MQSAYAVAGPETDFLRGLPAGEAERLLETAQSYSYSAGEIIYPAGDRSSHLLVLTQGAVKIWVKNPSPLILDIILPGDVFGGVSLSGETEDGEEAQALEHSVVRVLPIEQLLGNNGGRVGVAIQLLGLYNRRAIEARRQWRSVVSEDVPHRLGRRLLELLRQVPEGPGVSQIPVRLRQEDLAYLVGSTRTTVSEILNEFERRGLIELRRASVRVNRERLRQALWPTP